MDIGGQETAPGSSLTGDHVTFADNEVERAFISYFGSRGYWLEITVVNRDGHFEGRIKREIKP